jgi:hypothetical protein
VREVIISILRREHIEPTEEALAAFELGQKVAYSESIGKIYDIMVQKYLEAEAKKLLGGYIG